MEDLVKVSRVCFTGHRPPKVGGYLPSQTQREVIYFLDETVSHLKTYFEAAKHLWGQREDERMQWRTGGALGVDTWAADSVLLAGEDLYLDLPFAFMGDNWFKQSDKDKLKEHKDKAKEVHVCCPSFSNYAYLVRDRHMVDNSDLLVAVWDGSAGGTKHTFDYAQEKNLVIHRYNPLTKEKTFYVGLVEKPWQ